jgi:hypothetical protein
MLSPPKVIYCISLQIQKLFRLSSFSSLQGVEVKARSKGLLLLYLVQCSKSLQTVQNKLLVFTQPRSGPCCTSLTDPKPVRKVEIKYRPKALLHLPTKIHTFGFSFETRRWTPPLRVIHYYEKGPRCDGYLPEFQNKVLLQLARCAISGGFLKAT